MASNRVTRSNLALALAVAMLAPRLAAAEAAAPSSLAYEVVQSLGPDLGLHAGSYRVLPATLTVGRDGNVYGTTGQGNGTIFRIDGAGVFTTVHTFSLYGGPSSRLVVGADGSLYGITVASTVAFFRWDHDQGYTALSSPLPVALATDFVLGSDGAFYAGTQSHCGGCTTSLVKFTSDGTYTFLGEPTSPNSPTPAVVGSDGAIYGIRASEFYTPGGIFRLDTSGDFSIIHEFTADENAGGFLLGTDGLVYGIGSRYSANHSYDYVMRFDDMGNMTIVHQFAGTDGAPTGPLTVGSDGALYGVTTYGGTEGVGSVYRVDPAGAFTTLHSFDCTSGCFPEQGLMLARDGALWGVHHNPGAFRVDPSGTVASYPVIPSGVLADSPLVQGKDCALYGTGISFASAEGALIYRLFEPGHLCQEIDFDPLPDRKLGAPSFTVSATASSGLPVSFSASGHCTLSGDRVRLKRGVGVCRVTAHQDGDSRFQPAEPVTQEFRVRPPGRMRGHRQGR